MKKIIKVLVLCIVLCFTFTMFQACESTTDKVEVNVTGLDTLHVGYDMPEITISNGVEGELAWENPEQKLIAGENTYNYIFTNKKGVQTTYEIVLTVSDHTTTHDEVVDKAPTCTEEGIVHKVCDI